MRTIGFMVNPVAGIGGRVGLKGSDGREIQALAFAKGAKAEAPARGITALKRLKEEAPINSFRLLTAPQTMGEDEVQAAGLTAEVVGSLTGDATTAQDTIAIAKTMAEKGADLLIFAGGDGTARNICEAIGTSLPVIGIPAGVKIHSAVYALNPENAGKAAASFCREETVRCGEREVMDIDESAFRAGRVAARLYGYMKVPDFRRYIQSMKSGGYSEKTELMGIAGEIVERMEDDVVYIIGPGTTPRSIMERLDLPSTLLGMDAVKNCRLIGSDLSEGELFDLVRRETCRIVITVIGGQGHIFGRGNQQISPRIIRQVGMDNVTVIATKSKLFDLSSQALIVDTGDSDLDQALSGFRRVVTGYHDAVMFPVRS